MENGIKYLNLWPQLYISYRCTPKYKHPAINKNPQINKPLRFSHSRQNIKT